MRRTALKTDLGGDLQPSGAAAAEERVADAYIAGGREAQSPYMPSVRANAIGCGIGEEGGHQRADEIGMIQNVVSLKAEFQLHVLGDGGVLEDGKIKLTE